ncbi:fungal-specific transcription factor domain-containing protein [Lipomyces kononenkoae]|uniref:Fungal-specific transcription factor domain-containing protein n=1 Tax=Lipomyces kononenkoae TaxID=34357 RepID=A0ACC3STY4_LIPKO
MYQESRQPIYRDGKRNRRPTSCEQCRIRKMKCNRELPCESCIKRGERSTCKYASNSNRNAKFKKSNLGERLQRVESVVFELLQGELDKETSKHKDIDPFSKSQPWPFNSAAAPAPAQTETTPDEAQKPILHRKKQRNHQIDSTHWLSVLNDIKEVREQLSQSDIFTPEENDMHNEPEEDLLLKSTGSPDIQDIIQSLPPRPICDRMLSNYFNSSFTLPIVHSIKFQIEYEKFWQDPARAPALWIGLLFSMLSVVASALQVTEAVKQTSDQPILSAKVFRVKTAQCLTIGNYTNSPSSYTLPALLLHLLSKYIGKYDSSFDSWFLMGTIIRLAMRMGYHRDPKYRSDISPFDGEMRRRLWHAVVQLDVLLSFQMGMPSMIPSESCDTEPPGNLNDADISPNMEFLPASRPLTDSTPVLYTIIKCGLMNLFRKVIVHTQPAILSPSYAVTIELDGTLRQAYAAIPEDFKMRPISQSFLVPSGMIINRCTLELLNLKGIMVLHRRYLNTEEFDQRWDYSRRACIDAALLVLTRQVDIYEATQPGGQLYDDRWMVSSLTAHDFLLASMVLCLNLSVLMRSSNSGILARGSSSSSSSSLDTYPLSLCTNQMDALLNSQRIWAGQSTYSKEAHTASLILQLMITKVQGIDDKTRIRGGETNKTQIRGGETKVNNSETITSQDAMDPLKLDQSLLGFEAMGLPFAGTMTDMIDGSETIDWALLDQYLHNTGSMTPSFDLPDDSCDFLNT